MKRKTVLLLATLLTLACGVFAQKTPETRQNESQQSCRSYVQQFYNWYVPVALQDHNEPAWNIATRLKPTAFAPELLRALKRDSAAQSNSKDIVGLDFDPFLNSQDPSERFAVQEVKEQGAICLVTVVGLSAGESRERVTPEVKATNGRWQFVNFHYGSNDLIRLLHELEGGRKGSGKRR